MRLVVCIVVGSTVLAGCASEATCARNSDCDRGAYCSEGSCIADCTPSTAEERCGPGARCSSLGQCIPAGDAGLQDAPTAREDVPALDATVRSDAGEDAPLDAGRDAGEDAPSDTGTDAPADARVDLPDAPAVGPTLIFSEYVEGTSFNKAVEIRNFGASPLDLAALGCRVQIFHNGGASPSRDLALPGALAPGAVRVLCHTTAVISACEDRGTLDFNGDDAVALVCEGEVVDVIGQIGFRPDMAWGVAPTRTIDTTLRRACPATEADRSGGDPFDPAEAWRGLGVDVFDGLGSPTCAP